MEINKHANGEIVLVRSTSIIESHPIANPSEYEPPSPRKIRPFGQLKARKPRIAPAKTQEILASSRSPALWATEAIAMNEISDVMPAKPL